MYAFDDYVFTTERKNFSFAITIQYRRIDPDQTNGFIDYDITLFVDTLFEQYGVTILCILYSMPQVPVNDNGIGSSAAQYSHP